MRRAVASLCVAAVIAALIVTDLFFFPFELLRARAGAPEIPLRAAGEMRVHIVDVGQGDCAIVEFPDGSSMMIDGGDGAPAHTRAVIGYCMALGIERFGSVLLTHPDSDHAGGLDAVLSAFGAERIYLPMRFPAESGEEEYAGFFAAAEDSGAELIRTRALIPVLPEEDGPFYYGMFLSPLLPHGDAESDNEDSAVLYLEYAGRRFLFTGDAPVSVEESIARAYTETEGEVFTRTVQTGYGTFTLSPALADIDFFKAGHHGSASSNGAALLSLCRPAEFFISCGAGNSYGHPSLTAIGNVLAASPDARILRTDELGSIMISVRADGSYDVRAVG